MKWHICETDSGEASRLARDSRIPALVARILLGRGISTPDECSDFLSPRLDALHSPDLLPDIDRAVSAITAAVRQKRKIHICGDYDVDGITASSLLVNLLHMLGVKPEVFIPHRITDGYGLSEKVAGRIAGTHPDLVITVDCGTSDGASIALLAEAGAQVVVIDHHEPPSSGELPGAAVVNPKRSDSKYPFRELAAVGVVFKVAWAVAEELSPARKMSQEMRDFLIDSLALVTLGTVADVTPLIGENRVLVAYGLSSLRAATGPGLRSLITVSGLGGRSITARDIAFRIAPRLNAAGRLADARIGYELLTSTSTADADVLASKLEKLNTERQQLQQRTCAEAMERADRRAEPNVVVLQSPDWHLGVVGIAASRIVDHYHLPAILLVTEGDTARGSARSIPSFNMFEALNECGDLLIRWGGHAMAAGLTLRADLTDRLAGRLSEIAGRQFGAGIPEEVLEIDAITELAELDLGTAKEIERLAPFGKSNSRPVLAITDARVAGSPKIIGAGGNHISFRLAQGKTSLKAIWWQAADQIERLRNAGKCSVAFTPKVETWRGTTAVELVVEDIKTEGEEL